VNKLIVWLLGIIITLNLPLAGAEELSEVTHDINLYIFGEGGHNPSDPLNPSGNITTKHPDSTSDEYQIFYPKSNPPYDIFY
jgi:hypothetical protein